MQAGRSCFAGEVGISTCTEGLNRCGLDHFRSKGAKLIPPPTEPDPFENEAYRLWAIKQQRN